MCVLYGFELSFYKFLLTITSMGVLQKLKNENPIYFKGFVGISLLYALAAYFSSGFYHWDEYFQILEFTAYKWGKTSASDLPWEFEAGMRPWLQAFLIYPFKAIDPHWLVFALRLFTGQVMLWVLTSWFLISKDEFQIKNQKLYFWATYLLWFFPFLLVRYSSENFSCLFALIFFTLFLKKDNSRTSFIIMGVVAGISFWSRYQMGIFLFFPLFQILIKKNYWKERIATFIPFLLTCGLMIIIDYWGFNKWTLSPWNYVIQNLVYKKAANFGVNPVTDYLKWILLKPTPILGIPILFSIIYMSYKYIKRPIVQGILVFIVVHNSIGHKELRFLFPLIPFIPLYIFKTAEDLQVNQRWLRYLVIFNLFLLPTNFMALHPLEDFSKLTNKLDKIELVDEAYPLALGGRGGLKFNLFYDNLDKFSQDFGSAYKFINKTKTLENYLSQKKCTLIFSSRPLIEFQFKYKLLKKDKDVWALVKC